MFRNYMFINVANDESSSTYVRWLMMINARVQEFSRDVNYIMLFYFKEAIIKLIHRNSDSMYNKFIYSQNLKLLEYRSCMCIKSRISHNSYDLLLE